MTEQKLGFLLLNLGTPKEPTTASVKSYLREFLMDPFVLNIPWLWRRILVEGMILPFRSPRSAHAYQSIWMDQGSPLLVHSQNFTAAVRKEISSSVEVELAMRYGDPGLQEILRKWRELKLSKIFFLPLYPQYALSSTQSSVERLRLWLRKLKFDVPVYWMKDFFDHPAFIEPLAALLRSEKEKLNPQHILFSFHSLPVKHLTPLSDPDSGCCRESQCCFTLAEGNRNCYRAQCFSTARSLAHKLSLSANDYTISFQSRLGRAEWIGPNTEMILRQLGQKGIKRVLIACPSFVADCLETLEEIQIRGREIFKAAGGEQLKLVPCLNADPNWVKNVAELINQSQEPWQILEY